MTHPITAPGGWKLEYVVYPGGPGEIAIGVLQQERVIKPPLPGFQGRSVTDRMLGLRWCEGNERVDTWQEGNQDWFVVPFTFGAAIVRSLLQMKATGFAGLDEAGMQKLIEWVTDCDQGAVDNCICY